MYGRSQQTYRWHVPHANDRTQRMDRFSYSRYVSSRYYLIPDSIYFLYISVSSTSLTTRTESQHLLLFYSSSTLMLDVSILNSRCPNVPVSLSQATPPLWVELTF
jgi:hypothetical protein